MPITSRLFVMLIAVSAFFYSPEYVLATASWTNTGNMNHGKYLHTANKLGSGKVLVAGSGNTYTTQVNMYDPSSGTWSNKDALNTGRYRHTSVVVQINGGVERTLVVGGVNTSGTLSSAELYDESGNSWSYAASMDIARYNHSSAVLSDGKVIVTGGNPSGGGAPLSSVEIYDPVADTWTTKTSMGTARTSHKAIAIDGGTRVLVTGGVNSGGGLSSTEIYDVSGNSWSTGPTMSNAKWDHTVTLLPDGKVLITGKGYSQVFDPLYDTLNSAVSMVSNRSYHTANLITESDDSQHVLVVGGYGTATSTELYDISNDSWSSSTSMNNSHYYHTATTLNDGTVLVAGHGGGTLSDQKKTEYYTPE